MEHQDHVALIRGGVDPSSGGHWADLGAGGGAFTLALADLLGSAAQLVAVDRDGAALARLDEVLSRRFPAARLTTAVADFTRPLPIAEGSLDGVIAANSLHFVADRRPVLTQIGELLRTGGHLVVVEYDADRGNEWVPYPFTFERWQTAAVGAGFGAPRLVGRVPSRFLGAIYAAVCEWPGRPRERSVGHGTMPPHGEDREE